MTEIHEHFNKKFNDNIKLVRAINTIFDTEEGQLVLNHLEDRFLNGIRFNMADEYNNCIKQAFYNEGGANVIHYIKALKNTDLTKLQEQIKGE